MPSSDLSAGPIVCGTDYSIPAQRAADVAAALAKRLGTSLVLVHGIDERGEIPRRYWRALIDEAQPRLAVEATRLREFGIEVKQICSGGAPDEGVARCAEEMNARFIVLGSNGKGVLDRWVLGSAAERIAATARVPTLVVRAAEPLEEWAKGARALKIFVGADFTPSSDAALRWVGEMRRVGPCEIALGFVDRAPEESGQLAVYDALGLAEESPHASVTNEIDLRTKAQHYLDVAPATVRVIPGSKQIDTHLLNLAKEAAADLVVIGTHQWRGVSRLRYGSVSRRVLRNAQTNVVCVPSRTVSRRAEAEIPKVRRVLVATDLSAHGSRAIPHAYSVVQSGGSVCIVHVIPPGQPREPILAELRKLIPVAAELQAVQSAVNVLENSNAAAGICDAANRFDADLVCVGSHGRTGLLSVALGSVAQEVVARTARPVLIVRPPSS
jgi:nucleotide-binding universal stress UspA family protein